MGRKCRGGASCTVHSRPSTRKKTVMDKAHDFMEKVGDKIYEGGKATFVDTPASTEQVANLTPEQMEFQNSILPILKDILGDYGNLGQSRDDQSRNFLQEKTLPSIAERLTGLNGNNQLSYGTAMGNLESQLGSQRDMRGLQLLQFLLGPALQPQFNQIYNPSQPSFAQQFSLAAAPGIPQALGSYFMPDQTGIGSIYNKYNKTKL